MNQIILPLDIDTLDITGQHIDKKGNITLDVVSTCTEMACRKCGKPATKRYGHSHELLIHHTSVFDRAVILRIKPVRYQCEHCDDHPTTTEKYSWVAKGGKITKALEEFILSHVIHSTIQDTSKKLGISYHTIETTVNGRVGKQVDWSKHEVPPF